MYIINATLVKTQPMIATMANNRLKFDIFDHIYHSSQLDYD